MQGTSQEEELSFIMIYANKRSGMEFREIAQRKESKIAKIRSLVRTTARPRQAQGGRASLSGSQRARAGSGAAAPL